MKFIDNGPNQRRVIKAAAGALVGIIALAGCGNGGSGEEFGLQFPLPSCERGQDMPVTFPPLRTGRSLRIAEGKVGQDALKGGVVITPTGHGQFDIDKKNPKDNIGLNPGLQQAEFQAGDTVYTVQSRESENGDTLFTVRPVCPPQR